MRLSLRHLQLNHSLFAETEPTGPATTPGYSRREQVGWYFYDWANSAFSTTVVTVILGPYLSAVTQNAADANGFVYPFGIPVFAGSFFGYVVSLSVGLQFFLLPVLGAIADYSQMKKQLMAVTAYLGAFATMGMYFLQGDNYLLGGALPDLRQPVLWCFHRLLQRVPARDRKRRRSRQGLVAGMGVGVPGRRVAAWR